MAYNPDGKALASAGPDGTIKFWNVATGKEQVTLLPSAFPVAFRPDGKALASPAADQMVKLWDVKTAKMRATLKGHTHGGLSVGASFSPAQG